MTDKETIIGRRVNRIIESIKSDWVGMGYIKTPGDFPVSQEAVLERHIRAAIVVGMELENNLLAQEVALINGEDLARPRGVINSLLTTEEPPP